MTIAKKMENTWLLTWTTYGTWLPGDDRGFVGYVREKLRGDDTKLRDDAKLRADDASRRVKHNIYVTTYDQAQSSLQRYARDQMKGEPVWLTSTQAQVFMDETRRTADFRSWQLSAVAVMANHVHIVIDAPTELAGEKLLKEFKGYGSRALTQQFSKPASGTWWTKSGSTRLLTNESAISAAVEYVRNQSSPLVVWMADN